jgi:CxxC-x17-CxxC domain-containing protein
LILRFSFYLLPFIYMPDLELNCMQCRAVFIYTERQQEDNYRLNMPQPQRCSNCRPSRRKLAAAAVSDNQNTSKRYQIICDRCGKKDVVPFAPKPGRTVFCSDCHGASRSRVRAS